MSRRRFAALTAALTFCFLVWQALWALTTRPFGTPDEPMHVNSIIRVASTGEWPEPGEAYLDKSIFRASHQSGLLQAGWQDFGHSHKTSTRLGAPALYASVPVAPHRQREPLGSTHPVVTDQSHDQMTQHPALYYRLAGGALAAAGGLDWPWDRQLQFLRLFSVLLTAPLVPCTIYTVRRMGASRSGALLSSTLLYALPQVMFVTGAASNDSLAIGAGALVMAGVASAMFGHGGWMAVCVTGAALGLSLWTKGTTIPLGLVVGLAFLLNPRLGWRRGIARGVSAGLLGLILGGWPWIHNFLLYGRFQPSGGSRPVNATPGTDVPHLVNGSAQRFLSTFWGDFGGDNVVSLALQVVGTAVLVGIFVLAFTRQLGMRLRLANFLCYPVAVLGVLMAGAWETFRATGAVTGMQGRYLYPGLVGIVAALAAAWVGRPAVETNRVVLLRRCCVGVAVPLLIAVHAWHRQAINTYPLVETGIVKINQSRWAEVLGVGQGRIAVLLVAGFIALIGVIAVCAVATRYVVRIEAAQVEARPHSERVFG